MSHLFVRTITIAALVAAVAPSAQAKCEGSVVIYTGTVNADTRIDEYNASTNYGSLPFVGVGEFWGDASHNLFDLRASDMADALKTIDAYGACLLDARLFVYTSDPQGDTPQPVDLYMVKQFDASVVTWNTAPSYLSVYDTVVMDKGLNSFDIAQVVADWAPMYTSSDWGYLALVGATSGTDYLLWNDALEAGGGQEAYFTVAVQMP
jgi:hypothetical protein